MVPSPLHALIAREHTRELRSAAARSRYESDGYSPVTRVTLRFASAADTQKLRALAELDSAPAPSGPTLIAEIDGRLRAALPLDGADPIADPFHRGAELIELLRLRAAHLSRAY